MELGMKHKNLMKVLVLLLCLSACNASVFDQEVIPMPSLPETGMATVIGRVISNKTNEPIPNTIVRLAEVVRDDDGEGVYVLDLAFSPGAMTDEMGIFVFENIDAIEYVIVVGDIESIHEIVSDDSGIPRTWNAQPDDILQVGDLFVLLEPTQP